MTKLVSIILIAIFLLISTILGAKNSSIISFDYLVANIELSIATLLSIFFGIGFILGLLFALIYLIKYLKVKRQLHKHLKLTKK